jgi:hypothetical protein
MTEQDPTQDAGSGRSGDERSGSGGREAAWDEVAASFSNLGKQVRKRFERPAGETPVDETAAGQTPAGETPASGAPAAREGAGGEKVRRLIDTLDDTFTRLGETVRDPEFRKEAGSSVGRLGEALGITLREFGDQLQGRFGRSRTETAPGEDMPDVPPPPPASTPPQTPPQASPPPPPASTPPPPASTPPSSDTPPPPPPAPPKPDSGPSSAAPPDEPPPA